MTATEIEVEDGCLVLTLNDATIGAPVAKVAVALDLIPTAAAHDHCDWVHCSEEHYEAVEERDKIIDEVTRWHDQQGHIGGLRLCYEQPCRAIREAVDL